MSYAANSPLLTAQDILQWERDGYAIVRRLWTPEEVAACRQHFEGLSDGPAVPGHWEPTLDSVEPLLRYPRVMHPHRFDGFSRAMLLDRRVGEVLGVLMGEEPIATQSMFYFKPPGGKG